MVSAPRLIRVLARSTAFFPGQPPQLQKPMISMGYSSGTWLKTPFRSRTEMKSVVPGQ